MTSKEFISTSSQILFENMNKKVVYDEDKKYWKEKRSDTISKYLKNGLDKPYRDTIKNIFITRVSYNIYPEKYNADINEMEIRVFLNKGIYLLTSLFELNFSFLRSDDFEEYKTNVYSLIHILSTFFSNNFEKNTEEIQKELMDAYDDQMQSKHKFRKEEIDNFIEMSGKVFAQQQSYNKFYRESYITHLYTTACKFIKKTLDFFEFLLLNNNLNNEVMDESVRFYKYYFDMSNDIYNEFLFGEDVKGILRMIDNQENPPSLSSIFKDLLSVNSNSDSWKKELLVKIFSKGLLICLEMIIGYVSYDENKCFIEMCKYKSKIESFVEEFYNNDFDDKYEKYLKSENKKNKKLIIDKNYYLFKNEIFISLQNIINNAIKYININRSIYFYLQSDTEKNL